VTSPRRADVIVVGAGIMGASAAWHLASRGLKTVLLEQFELDHQRGSSHGSARIFRLVYDIPEYVELARQALPLWRRAERELDRDLLWTTGGLDIGPPTEIAALSTVLSAQGVSHELLSSWMLRDRFPAFTVPESWEALSQPEGGVLHADACRLGLAELARRAGATILPRTPVLSLEPSNSGVSLMTPDGRWDAESAVLTAAGWTNRLIEPLGLHVPLRVTREHVAYYRGHHAERIVPFIFRQAPQRFHFYGLPNWQSGEVKVGINASGPETDPDAEPVLDAEMVRSISESVHRYLPSLDLEPQSVETCLYASTPDDDFVLERTGSLVLGVGFGGHGYKFGAVIGSLLADLVEGASLSLPSRFALSRFTAQATSPRNR
jgi:sarcosine oxidase